MKLAEKHRPKSMQHIKGQDKALQTIHQAIQQKKPVLLYGPPGTGKTSIAHALAEDMNYEIIEINASDTRNKEAIQNIVGQASQQQSLFSQGKIILIDELDGISGTEDRGGLTELASILDLKTPYPIILTANDPWDSKFNTLRKKCVTIEISSLNYLSIAHLLKNISEQEKLTIDEDTIKRLAHMAGGDARAAINDLEILSLHNKNITKEDLEELDQREQTGNIFQALRHVFKGTDANQARHAYDNLDIDMDEIFLWLDENLPLEYQGKDLATAYERLSTADIIKKRIQRQQHWRFMAYIYDLLSAGIATAKQEKSPGYVGYQRTQRILKLWIAKQKNAKKKEIAATLKPELHASIKRITQDVIPYLKIIAKKDKNFNPGLEEEELEWLQK
ncbi:MAG TPA: replication factor C large subunit [Candidatus Nanoarchaeia archaeon]|nr:replication factor C large subunit [Candidatus Nanoarchaeia archaeon]